MRRWHLWMGWIAGIPLLLWVVSGLVMVSRPIAETRSESALRPAEPVRLQALVAPVLVRKDVASVTLSSPPGGPRWRIGYADGSARAADALTGQNIPRIAPAAAVEAALARYTGTAKVESVSFVERTNRPREFGRPVDAWRVRLDDGLHLYVDAWSGDVLVARSRWWRIYDFFWGLHIMDLQGRDNPNNPWVVSFVAFAFATMIVALILLPGSTRRMLRSGAKTQQGE